MPSAGVARATVSAGRLPPSRSRADAVGQLDRLARSDLALLPADAGPDPAAHDGHALVPVRMAVHPRRASTDGQVAPALDVRAAVSAPRASAT